MSWGVGARVRGAADVVVALLVLGLVVLAVGPLSAADRRSLEGDLNT